MVFLGGCRDTAAYGTGNEGHTEWLTEQAAEEPEDAVGGEVGGYVGAEVGKPGLGFELLSHAVDLLTLRLERLQDFVGVALLKGHLDDEFLFVVGHSGVDVFKHLLAKEGVYGLVEGHGSGVTLRKTAGHGGWLSLRGNRRARWLKGRSSGGCRRCRPCP